MTEKTNNSPGNRRFDESVRFVARYYRQNAFTGKNPLWRQVIEPHSRWRRYGVAAAVAGVVLTMSAIGAFIVFNQKPVEQPVRVETTTSAPKAVPMKAASVSMKISFTEANLPEVCAKIEDVYGVELTNIPGDAEPLTLDYEGTAADLVETINELLGTNIEIRK